MNDTTTNIGGQDGHASIEEWSQAGTNGQIVARSWSRPEEQPRFLAILVHGYGEHIGRYDHVAEALIDVGAFVCGLDHMGHGKSDGERVLITDFEDVVTDVRRVLDHVREQWPELPVVMIGHSMGGLIAARYAQLHHDELTALVLSGALIGEFDLVPQLLALDEMPDVPLDPAVLSRDLDVGDAYAADPLVWHGPFKRPTVEAMGVMLAAIHDGPSIHDLPLMWIHGEADQLVPIGGTRVGIERLRGARFRERTYQGARHEVFNETNSADVIADVTSFISDALADAEI